MEIRIQAFAALRDHFGDETRLEIEEGVRAAEILERLSELRPAARDLLASSRLAVGEALVEADYAPTRAEFENGELFLLPPASGG